MKRIRWFAVVLSVVVVLSSVSATATDNTSLTPKTETGADTRSWAEMINAMTPEQRTENAAELAAKAQAAAQYREPSHGISPFYSMSLGTPLIYQSLPQSVDTWATTNSTLWPSSMNQYSGSYGDRKTPADSNARVCAHCGAASTAITLRWLASSNMANMSDVSTSDKQAVFDLGVGWMSGAYSTDTWHIQTCCDGSIGFGTNDGIHTNYYNDMAQMKSVLQQRVNVGWYVLGSYSSQSTFLSNVRFDITHNYPLIISVNMTYLPYMNRTHQSGFGHIIVVDGYQEDSSGNITQLEVNDPNDCSANNSPGKHWVSTSDLWAAMTNAPSNAYIW